MDSNDRERVNEAREELTRMLAEDELRDAVLLVFANKQVRESRAHNLLNPKSISSPSIYWVCFQSSAMADIMYDCVLDTVFLI